MPTPDAPALPVAAAPALVRDALSIADNAAILVGTIQGTPAERPGEAIATRTFLAAPMALLGPPAIGAVLDGPDAAAAAWSLAFIVMTLGPAWVRPASSDPSVQQWKRRNIILIDRCRQDVPRIVRRIRPPAIRASRHQLAQERR